MGFWGEYPSDNDTAYDLMSYIEDAVNKELHNVFKTYSKRTIDNFSKVGLVLLLFEKGFSVDISTCNLCMKYLDETLECKQIMLAWKNPDKAKAIITKVRDTFGQLIKENKEKRLRISRRAKRHLKSRPLIENRIHGYDYVKLIEPKYEFNIASNLHPLKSKLEDKKRGNS
jgi:hypothetical protein